MREFLRAATTESHTHPAAETTTHVDSLAQLWRQEVGDPGGAGPEIQAGQGRAPCEHCTGGAVADSPASGSPLFLFFFKFLNLFLFFIFLN